MRVRPFVGLLLIWSCGGSKDVARDAGGDVAQDVGADGNLDPCCPLDFYMCDGGRRGGKRPANGVCQVYFDEYFSPRVETVDEYGCPIIDLTKSTSRSCFSFPDAAPIDGQSDVPDSLPTARDAADD